MENYFDKDNKDTVDLDVALENPLDDNLINSLMFTRDSGLLLHNLIKAEKENYEEFTEKDWLYKGQQYFSYIPEYNPNDKSKYEISELINTKSYKKLITKLIEPSLESPYESSILTMEYKLEADQKAKYSINFIYQTNDTTVKQLTKIVLKQYMKRFDKLAQNPKQVLNDLKLINRLPYKKANDCNFYGLPNSITTQFSLPENRDICLKTTAKNEFLSKILPGITLNTIDLEKYYQLGDLFTYETKTIEIGSEKPEIETIEFEVKSVGNQFHFLSKDSVKYFKQIGFSIEFPETNEENKTLIFIGFYYTTTRLVSGANYGAKFLRYFCSKKLAPNIEKLLLLRSKNLFDTFTRHVIKQLTEQTIDQINFSDSSESTVSLKFQR